MRNVEQFLGPFIFSPSLCTISVVSPFAPLKIAYDSHIHLLEYKRCTMNNTIDGNNLLEKKENIKEFKC